MFNRSPTPDASPSGVPKPQISPVSSNGTYTTSGPRNSPFDAASTMGTSVIGTDLTILGEKITIISQNKLQIEGDIRGDVNGKQVTIGQDGSVIGTVSAERIEVHGGVRGAIRASSVTLHPTAQVDGDIVHQSLSISEGAQFDGRVRRAKDGNELVPVLDPNQISPGHNQPTS